MRFGASDDKGMSFNVHIDVDTGLNIGNICLHKWVVAKYLYIAQRYKIFGDKEKFVLLVLKFVVEDVQNVENNT